MARWTADVFVNSQVGTIKTEVDAATYSGARQQIYAKHGDVQTITNLREVRSGNSSSASVGDVGGGAALVGLIAIAWLFITFTPWIMMGLGGAIGTWIGEKVTGQSIEEYTERDDDSGHGKAAIALVLALLAGGFGFVQGHEMKKGFDSPSSNVEQVRSK